MVRQEITCGTCAGYQCVNGPLGLLPHDPVGQLAAPDPASQEILHHRHGPKGLQPDILVNGIDTMTNIKPTNCGRRVVFDVAVVDRSVADAVAFKIAKYQAKCEENHLIFHPLVFHALGSWNDTVDHWITGCVKKTVNDKNLGIKEAKKQIARMSMYWRKRICVSLHNSIAFQLISRYNYLVGTGVLNNQVDESRHGWAPAVLGNV